MKSNYKIEPKRVEPQPKKSPHAASSSNSLHSHLEKLFAIEAAARGARSLAELQYVIVNESLKLLNARQIVLFRGKPSDAGWRIEKISSVSDVDRNAPLVRWLAKSISKKLEGSSFEQLISFKLAPSEETVIYPFSNGLFLPIKNHEGAVLGGFSLLSEEVFDQNTTDLAVHLQGTFAHAWAALAPKHHWSLRLMTRRNGLIASLGLFALMCLPVPLTVLAPVEVVARDPVVVASPLQGVIEKISVRPNQPVEQGALLFSFNRLELASRLAVAEREMEVARAKFQRSTQTAFLDRVSRKELAVTKAELEVAKAEYDFAARQLALTEMTAPAQGVVLFSSRDDWEGRPVSVGERVMRLADPSHTALKIGLSVSDAVMLEQELNVRVFLDANPLSPYSATITRKSFAADRQKDGNLVFPVHAELVDTDADVRIGWRGTAQLSGNYVPLAYNLLRKPISAIRQYLGI